MTVPGAEGPVSLDTLLAYRDWVRALARSLYLDRNRADDLEQETWRMVLERPPRHAGSLRAWFATAVRHAASSLGRKERVRSAREPATPPRPPSASPEEADLAAAELQTRLAREVLALDEPYRTTVVLRYFEGLEAQEIATRLSVPVETVRTRLKRAIAQLRERMETDLGDDQAAWCLLVFGVRRLPKPAVPISTATAAAWGGGLVMAGATKLAIGAAVVAVAAGLWLWPKGADPDGPPKETAVVPTETSKPPAAKRASRSASAETDVAPAAADVPAVPAEIPLGPDVVHGRVLDDDTSLPVANVTVTLIHENARRPGNEPNAVTKTDGTFRVAGGGDGSFDTIALDADGYAACLVYLPWRSDDAKLEKNDAGDVRIFRGKRIAGRVLAADGVSPVAAASVRITTNLGSSGTMWINYSKELGRSGADGTFALERVPPSHKSFAAYTLFAVAGAGVGWTKLAFDAGRVDTPGADVVLRPAGGARVTVRDAAGAPKAGARVVASPRFEPLGPNANWDVGHDTYLKDEVIAGVFAATTDAEGLARFDVLPTGEDRSPYDFTVLESAWKRATVAANRVVEVEVIVTPPKTRAIAGLVHRPDGTPVADASVRAAGFPDGTKTGADGRFRMEAVVPSWGNQSWIQFQCTAGGLALLERSLTPDAKQDVLELDITMKPAAPIAGRVVDQDGKPVAGATLRTERDDSSINGRYVKTGADGAFEFTDTVAGEYAISVDPPAPVDQWGWAAGTRLKGGDRGVVIVLPRVAPGKARFVATLVDEAGAPVAPDEVSLTAVEWDTSLARIAYSGVKHGNGTLVIDRMKPGRWLVWIRVPGRIGTVERVTVTADDAEIARRIVVGRPGVLRGRIDAGDSGLPLPSMVIPDVPDIGSLHEWARPKEPGMVGAAKVRSDGTFEFPSVMPGRWRVWLAGGKGLVGEAVVEVPAGGAGECVIRLSRESTLVFRVPAPPSAFVSLSLGGETFALRRLSDFKVVPGEPVEATHRVCAGTYRWRARFPAQSDWPFRRFAAEEQSGEVVVAEGETAVVEVPVVPR